MSQEIMAVRNEFFELYQLLSKQSILKDDIISIGNLALFVDYSLPRYKWLEKKKQIQEFVRKKDKNEVNMLLASHLYEIALRLNISDNLSYKLEKMTASYKENNLQYFDIVLDVYDFPDWFKRIMVYLPVQNQRDLYMRLLERFKGYPSFGERENKVALAYYADKIYHDTDCFQSLTELEGLVTDKKESEIAWFLATSIFGYFYPEMEKLNQKEENIYALRKLKEYKVRHEQYQLDRFDIFSQPMNERLFMKYERST